MSDELTAVYMYAKAESNEKIRELEATICDLKILLKKKTERIVELEETVQDYKDCSEQVLENEPRHDEVHCGCVMYYRKRIVELEAKAEQRIAFIEGGNNEGRN